MFVLFTCQARNMKERTYSRVPNTLHPGKKTCILLDYFGSFCGKSTENRRRHWLPCVLSTIGSYTLKNGTSRWRDPICPMWACRGCDSLLQTHRTLFFIWSPISTLLEGLKNIITLGSFVKLITEKEEKAQESHCR